MKGIPIGPLAQWGKDLTYCLTPFFCLVNWDRYYPGSACWGTDLRPGRILSIKKSFENVGKFKYLRVRVTNTDDIRKHIKLRINKENAYYSLEKNLSSRLLSKKLEFNAYKELYYQVYCKVVKFGPSPWERSRILECSTIKCLERYLGMREVKLQESGESYIMLSYMHCILHHDQT